MNTEAPHACPTVTEIRNGPHFRSPLHTRLREADLEDAPSTFQGLVGTVGKYVDHRTQVLPWNRRPWTHTCIALASSQSAPSIAAGSITHHGLYHALGSYCFFFSLFAKLHAAFLCCEADDLRQTPTTTTSSRCCYLHGLALCEAVV